jgi:hypothetical protein
MGSKIFGGLILVALCACGFYFLYIHLHEEKMATDGDVTWQSGEPSPEAKARFAKENAGETPDGQSEHKEHTATEDAANAATGTAEVGPAGKTDTPAGATTPAAATPAAATRPAPASRTDAVLGAIGLGSNATPTNLPTSDSVPPNPPNGARFAGSGTYQWYRQGNLTWRVNTVSGHSCIDYATIEEWHKPIVSSHGCGRGA